MPGLTNIMLLKRLEDTLRQQPELANEDALVHISGQEGTLRVIATTNSKDFPKKEDDTSRTFVIIAGS